MKKIQTGWVIIVVTLVAWFFVMFFYRELYASMTISLVSLLILLLFYKLTVEVSDKHVSFYMGIGLIRRTFALKDIIHCKPISYMPLGWGIRFRPGAILYNVSGTKAIELKLKNKRWNVWIGTDVPDELADYINSKL
ncbi:MAG: hypothetical protein N4A71_23960 [Carboxylicivirga sp.]|jgi:hypothetical protein|nr:hypothetical protein [Carboxylicivirga sp.]